MSQVVKYLANVQSHLSVMEDAGCFCFGCGSDYMLNGFAFNEDGAIEKGLGFCRE